MWLTVNDQAAYRGCPSVNAACGLSLLAVSRGGYSQDAALGILAAVQLELTAQNAEGWELYRERTPVIYI